MKVISGKFKGRLIDGYDIIGTRPTISRVKESTFAMIQNYITNANVLDLFAGSGNLGIEALSNGAKKTWFNDNNKKCINIIKNNLERLNIFKDNVVTNLDYKEALKLYYDNNIKFDLVFLDPPYKKHIIGDILSYIIDKDLLNDNGLIICEVNNKEIITDNKLCLFKERNYGDKSIIIYQKTCN